MKRKLACTYMLCQAAFVVIGLAQSPSPANPGQTQATQRVDAETLRKRGEADLFGKGVQTNLSEARRLLESAAEAGDGEALFFLGYMSAEGRGAMKDPVAARAWFENAAAKDSVGGLINLGIYLVRGTGGPADKTRGVSLLERAASLGSADAALVLAEFYMFGDVTPDGAPDYKRTRELILPLADRGNAKAQNMMGVLERDGRLGNSDEKAARAWFQKASWQGEAKACTNLGLLDYQSQDTATQTEGLTWLLIGSELGDPAGLAAVNEYLKPEDPRLIEPRKRCAERVQSIRNRN